MGQNHAAAGAQDANVEVRPIDPNLVPNTPTTTACAADSDLMRLALLNKFGGLAIDTDVEPGQPLPALNATDSTALFVPAKPGKPRDAAIGCTIGSQRVASLLTKTLTANTTTLDAGSVAQDPDLPEQCFTSSTSTSTT